MQNWGNALFAGFNAFAASWAILAYIGFKNILVDIWLGLTDILYVESDREKPSRKKVEDEELFNWKGVLYQGEANASVPHESLSGMMLSEKTRSL